jgi:RNA polymerase sigma-70 factor, ECF subfamily
VSQLFRNEFAPLGERWGVVVLAPTLSVADGGPRAAAGAELQRAGEQLYQRHFEFVWRNARRLGCSDEWAEDAVHEIFMVATRRWSEFEGRSSERTWLFSIARNVVRRMQRDRARQRQHLARYAVEQPPVLTHPAEQSEAAAYLRHLLQALSEEQRAVVILAELEGFSTAEIAESLSVPRGTIDSRLRKARVALSEAIARDRARRFGP